MACAISQRVTENELVTRLLRTVSADTLSRILIGVLAGYSITLLTGSAAITPPIERIPVQLLGLGGFAVAVAAYYRLGRCETSDDCGCSGDCESA